MRANPDHPGRTTIAHMMRRSIGCAAVGLVAMVATAAVSAQALEAPPAMGPAASAATREAAPAAKPPPADAEAVPDELPPARQVATETRIEQRRAGNRIVEVTVTPAGSQRSYFIVNQEGQRPANVQDLSAGLSTPRFFKFDF